MEIFGGNAAFTGTKVTVPAELAQAAAELSAQGKTPLFFGGAGRLLGVIAVADTIKVLGKEVLKARKEWQ